jgi:iron complex outermembrane receptor protein
MFTNTKLSKAVRLAVAFGAASTAAFTGSVSAQEAEEAKDVERIEVTGSRIKRTDIESASPITVFNAEDLAKSGHVTIEKFVHSIPAMNGGMNGSNTNNGSGGAASANLRGLGAARTLVLINGRRYASGDLNSIPMAFIERVEVLRDGASTIYGSDAIAGVINFITKKNFEGVELTAQYDLAGEGDGETSRVGATIGTSSDKGNVVISLEYANRNTIWQKDRDFSKQPFAESGGALIPTGSGANAFGTWVSTVPGSQYATGGPYVVDPTTGAVRKYAPATDSYNYATASYLVTPQDVFSINSAASYEIADDVKAFLEGGYTNRQSDQLMAADATFWGATVTADHPNNPIGEDVVISRRLTETGGRSFNQDFSDFRMVTGFEGFLENGWSWDVSYNYARYTDASLDIGRANTKRYNLMLDPTACAEDAGCTAVGLWNPFQADSLTPQQVAFGSIPNSPVDTGVTKQFMANLTGDTGDFGLEAGSIGWATGVEKRWESYRSIPDGGALIGEIYGVVGEPTEGAYDLDEAYAEINVPILAGLSYAERLDFSAAVRSTNYNFLQSQITKKFGVEYSPVTSLLVRATYADGFRAPSITDLYSPQAESNTPYVDPCLEYATNGSASATLKANCAAEGLPGNFLLPNNQSATLEGGNPNVGPEESTSTTVGFVYTPEFVENLTVAIDYYKVEIDGAIGVPNISAVIQSCYDSPNFSSASCALIGGPGAVDRPGLQGSKFRDFQGYVVGVTGAPSNIATFETAGYDFDASWYKDLGTGRLNVRLDGTYLTEYSYQSQEGADVLDLAGKYGIDPNFGGRAVAFSKLRTNLTLGYGTDDWNVSWIGRFQSNVENMQAAPNKVSNETGAYVYHDVQGSYFYDNLTFTLGARNVFDKQPPYVSNNNDMNTLNSSYDTAGAYFYGRVSAKF